MYETTQRKQGWSGNKIDEDDAGSDVDADAELDARREKTATLSRRLIRFVAVPQDGGDEECPPHFDCHPGVDDAFALADNVPWGPTMPSPQVEWAKPCLSDNFPESFACPVPNPRETMLDTWSDLATPDHTVEQGVVEIMVAIIRKRFSREIGDRNLLVLAPCHAPYDEFVVPEIVRANHQHIYGVLYLPEHYVAYHLDMKEKTFTVFESLAPDEVQTSALERYLVNRDDSVPLRPYAIWTACCFFERVVQELRHTLCDESFDLTFVVDHAERHRQIELECALASTNKLIDLISGEMGCSSRLRCFAWRNHLKERLEREPNWDLSLHEYLPRIMFRNN